MGRYRSDESDDEYSKKSKKKKKRRGRSRSSSDSESSRMSSSKSKKSKKKHRRSSRSRSHSGERRRGGHEARSSRRSRSTSGDRYGSRRHRSQSRSRGGGRRSRTRSPAPRHGRSKSRSPSSRRKRSRSYSRGRRSQSPSRGRRRGSRSYSRERRSQSHDRSTSQRSSVESRRDRGHATASPSNVTVQGLSISEQVPGYSEMTPAEQAEERMRLALKAAAAADEKLKGKTTMETSGSFSTAFEDSKSFANSIAAIESGSFVQSSFKSSRSTKIKEEPYEGGSTHEDAIFGSLAVTGFTLTPDPDTKPVQLDPDSIMHPSLYCDPEEKLDRWIQRLAQLRKRKLEGEAMSG